MGVLTGVEDLLRTAAPQVLAAVARRYGDFDAAEDAVQEALLAASRQWPDDGVPDNPVAWLIRVASRRLIEIVRNEQARRRRAQQVLDHGQNSQPLMSSTGRTSTSVYLASGTRAAHATASSSPGVSIR